MKPVLFFSNFCNNLHAKLTAELAAVEGYMVVFGSSPFSACKVFVVNCSFCILFLKALAGTLVAYAVKLNDSFCLVVLIGVNKNVEAILSVAKNEIGASAYNYAVSFFGKLGNNAALGGP